MILNAVIIILREVLEASLIIGVFLALSRLMARDRYWIMLSLIPGALGAIVYASTISYISAAFEGVGQELLNALLHSLIYINLLLFTLSIIHPQRSTIARLAMMMAVFIATGREGAEIMLYINGFSARPDLLTPVLLGGAVGTGIGISVGIFIYYLLVNLPVKWGMGIGFFLIVLLAGSMVSQAVQFLIQADVISSARAIWDTSDLISERSVTGQLLYALIGYEATPAPIQAIAYFSSMMLIGGALVFSHLIKKEKGQL